MAECYRNCAEISYQYDTENRLSAVYDKQKLLMAAAYDGDGNRAFQLNYNPEAVCGYGKNVSGEIFIPENNRDENGELTAEGELFGAICSATGRSYDLTEYVNDTNRRYTEVLEAYTINSGATEAYSYAGNMRISRNNVWTVSRDCVADEMSYYLYDGRGSVTANTWYNGMVTNVYQYDPYGQVTLGGTEHRDFYGYNGESYNPNTGLEYLRARYYNADKGRFFQEDAYLGVPSDPRTLNRYAYVKNSPLNYVDPSGHEAMDAENSPGRYKKINIVEMTLPVEDFADWDSEIIGTKRPRRDIMKELAKQIKEARESISEWCGTFNEGRMARRYYLDQTSFLYHFLSGESEFHTEYRYRHEGFVEEEVREWRDSVEDEYAFLLGYIMEDVILAGQILSLIIIITSGAPDSSMSNQPQRVAVTPNDQAVVIGGEAAGSAIPFDISWYLMNRYSEGDDEGDSDSPKVNYKGEESSVYRGEDDFTVKSNEVKINPETGNVKTSHGVSLDVNPDTVSKFGGAYKIESLPEGLKIIQRGMRAEHFEIVPAYEMPLETFQELLNQIVVSGPY